MQLIQPSEPFNPNQMKTLNKYSKLIPYFYFIAVVAYWFTDVNKTEGITAFPILLFSIPFIWQILKPKSKLNHTLGITLVSLKLYFISANIVGFFHMSSMTDRTTDFVIYGGLLVILVSGIKMWIVTNDRRQSF